MNNSVFAAGEADANGDLKKFDSEGNLSWGITDGNDAYDLSARTTSGDIYLVADDYSVRKYSGADGTLIWTKAAGSGCERYIVWVDSDEYVYFNEYDDPELELRMYKYASNGDLVFSKVLYDWAVDYGISGSQFTVDSNGNFYVHIIEEHDDVKIYFMQKYDSGGNIIWTKNLPENFIYFAWPMGLDDTLYSYEIDDNTNYLIKKYDSNGNVILSFTIDSNEYYPYGISSDINGNIYTYGEQWTGDYYPAVRKYDNSGNFVWEKEFQDWYYYLTSIDINSTGEIAISGEWGDIMNGVYVLNPDKSVLWNAIHESYLWVVRFGQAGAVPPPPPAEEDFAFAM